LPHAIIFWRGDSVFVTMETMSVLHELPLVSTIAIGLSVAFLGGLAATKLRLSPLVGYLLAGIIIGPHTPGFNADEDIAEQLSEIGIVLLMFGVGLHFSVKDFMEVRKIAAVGAIVRIGIITAIGYFLSSYWGWSTGAGIIFGLCLSVASTVVLMRTLDENHLMQTITGKIAIGWLIVEDMAMILAMIMLPALAPAGTGATNEGHGIAVQILIAISKAGLFAAIMFIAGRRVLPWLLTAVSRTGSRELFTLAAICVAMGIAFCSALLFGVSLALGAFFAGMMIRESDLNHEVAARLLPLQDAFAVLFFVAVGMLFDPSILIERPLDVMITVLVIIAVKALITFGIVRSFGYPMRTTLKISAGLAQIGEFSFILIALGTTLGLMPPEERNLILSGALFSIALNPICFNAVRRWCDTHSDPAISMRDNLSHLNTNAAKLRNMVLLIGFGRVGAHATSMLDPADVDLIILDSNREKVKHLRNNGFNAIAGDATSRETLIEAQIEKAQVVFITVPEPFEARSIVEQIKTLKPDIRIFVRSHNDEEKYFFENQDVELAVTGAEEIARRMVSGLSGA
jgi:CPA2 family monovalent cation:H+ antiporter-2